MARQHAAHSPLRILVTGAGSGIGRGLALGLAGEDRVVVASDFDAEAAKSTVEAIRAKDFQAQAMALDVTSDEHLVALAESEPFDVLVNNAGVQHVARLEQFPPEQWRRLVDVMLNGVAMTTRAVLPAMRRKGFGRIVNIGSVHSIVASPYKSAYVAAKHGLLGLSKVLALETADTDITINTVCPAYVQTPLVDNQIADQAREHGISEDEVVKEIMLKPMPKKTFISIDEMTGIVEFLIGPAAKNITGQTIVVDGGWTAQ